MQEEPRVRSRREDDSAPCGTSLMRACGRS